MEPTEIVKKNTTRKKPCPKGTRANKNGDCIPIKIKQPTIAPAPVPSPVQVLIPSPVPSPVPNAPLTLAPTSMKERKAPCPKGTRRNKKTGLCVPNTIKPTAATVNAPGPGPATVNAPVPGPVNAPGPAPAPTSLTVDLESVDPDAPLNIQNQKKNKLELLERAELTSFGASDYDFLYPNLNDPAFNVKLSERKEFNDNKYDGDIYPDVATQVDLLCNSAFELAPHQIFVRNFLSFQTPYNSLLLYHGLGSGKTCSAISVAEEMRDYIMQMGISSQIMIVASPNVQTNFRVQLFDEHKLKLVDGLWNIRDCIGNKFLKEEFVIAAKANEELDKSFLGIVL